MGKDDSKKTSGGKDVKKGKRSRREPNQFSEPSIRGTGVDLWKPDSASEGFVKKQLNRLQSKVEDISRVPKEEKLSHSQVDVLRKYIEVKELEVRDLKDQKLQYENYVEKLSEELDRQDNANRELQEKLEALATQRDQLKSRLDSLASKKDGQMAALKSEYDDKMKSFSGYEEKLKALKREREDWKEKVRSDLKKIKLKEKEIENKYELLKRDAQALLDSKDKHVLELKKKSDTLEMELETAEEKLRANATTLGLIDSKKRRLIETLKLAVSLLQEIDKDSDSPEDSDSSNQKKAS